MRMMSKLLVALWAVLSVGAAPVRAAGEPAYPATEPGRHAREFFAAYAKDEAAMRAFYSANISAADLAARTPDQRLEVWRDMRANRGQLTAVRVLGAGDDFIDVLVRDEHGESSRFHFACAAEAPHTMRGVMVTDADDADAAPAAPSGPPPSEAQIVAALRTQVDSLAHAGAFSGVALLDRDGTQLFATAVGEASRATHTANTLDTRFNLGSINKIFTTVAILQLAHAGKLSLSDHIDKYLPDYPREAAAKITIEMLLHHRAGVPDMLESPDLWKAPATVTTTAAWYALVRPMPLRFEPGTSEEYSNGGYVLLGAIIAKVSGEDYYDYVQHHIYEPAGMTHTAHDLFAHLAPGTATPYTRRGGAHGGGVDEPRGVDDMPGRGSSAGGGYSTAGDLLLFARALRAGTLLDPETAKAFAGPHGGLGIAGGSPGVNAYLETAGPYTLIVLANQDPPAAERFARTVGAMVRRAGSGGAPEGERHILRAH